MPPYISVLRPRQWTKNLIVFGAPLFAVQIDPDTVLTTLLAFALLCLASSSFYIFNDVSDLESDRQHPIKRRRPIAAGQVRIPVALGMAVGMLGLALVASWIQSRGLGTVISAYALLQFAYNLRLKRTVILDVMTIATGFVLRAVAGAAATGIPMSPWFLLCTALLALFLGIEKRKAELRLLGDEGAKTRKVLLRYSVPLLSRMESTVAAGAIITYAIWSSGPQVKGASTPWMLITIPFVLYGIFRYQLLSTPREAADKGGENPDDGEQSERPEEILLNDLPILLNTFVWMMVSFLIMLAQKRGLIQ